MPSITLPTRAGYKFDYYTDSSGTKYYVSSTTDSHTYTTVGNKTLTAHWTVAYLSITNQGKSGTSWSIKITNTSSTTVTVYYNSKMCNYSDAQNWTGLSDVKSFTLAPGASKTVTISENWFATSIAISYTGGGYRMITYANELTSSGGMSVQYNRIST